MIQMVLDYIANLPAPLFLALLMAIPFVCWGLVELVGVVGYFLTRRQRNKRAP